VDKRQSEIIEKLSVYYDAGQSELCGAALYLLRDNPELIALTDGQNENIQVLEKICSGNLLKFLSCSLSKGELKNRLIIEKQGSFITIPAGTKIVFVPPFTIDFEVSSNVFVSLDLFPELELSFLDELNKVEVNDLETALGDNNYSVKITL